MGDINLISQTRSRLEIDKSITCRFVIKRTDRCFCKYKLWAKSNVLDFFFRPPFPALHSEFGRWAKSSVLDFFFRPPVPALHSEFGRWAKSSVLDFVNIFLILNK